MRPMYPDNDKTEQVMHLFGKHIAQQENLDSFKSWIHGLDMQKIKHIPLTHNQPYEISSEFRNDPYLLASKIYEENNMIINKSARFHKDHLFGNPS